VLSLKIEQTQADKFAEKMWQNVQNQLNRIIKDNGLKATTKRVQIVLSINESDFLKSINTEVKLKEILSSNPKKLRALIDDLEPQMTDNLKNVLYNAFVSRVYEKPTKFDGLKFVDDIGLQTCPYCNRAYIQSVSKRGVVRPQIDHFYPKSKYPYLGLSFYNLIPSCSVCNGTTAKGDKDSFKDSLISPYEINNDDFKFSFDFLTVNNLQVRLDTKFPIHNDYFKLEDFYKHHADVVTELYTKLYREETKEHFESLQKSLSDIGFDSDEIHRFITCGYLKDEDLHKRPLSKLIKDVSEELGSL